MTKTRKHPRRRQRGGFITKMKQMMFGDSSLTRVKEIRITTTTDGTEQCENITKENNSMLFDVREIMLNRPNYAPAGEYYFPLENDTDEVKVQKCKRLNALRLEWIALKKKETAVGEQDSQFTWNSKTKIPLYGRNTVEKGMVTDVNTRFLSFLMDMYCNIDENVDESPDVCIQYQRMEPMMKISNTSVGGKKTHMYRKTRKTKSSGSRKKRHSRK
jgi:hypothetical protein